MLSRRRFLAAGVLGAAALATAGWWATRHRASTAQPGKALSPDALAIVAAIVPAMLGPALPGGGEHDVALSETVDGVDRAVAGLAPAAQNELAQLFALLSLAPGRQAFAGVATDWAQAPKDEVAAFLERWRSSGWAIKRSAYDALHQLVMAAWYGNPRSWTAIGYGGPPRIGA